MKSKVKKGIYVCIIKDTLSNTKSKQTFITRSSPTYIEIKEDVDKKLNQYNKTHKKKHLVFEKVSSYADGELKYVFPFIKDGYEDLRSFLIETFKLETEEEIKYYLEIYKSKIINPVNIIKN